MKSLSSSVLALAPSMTVAIDTRAKELQAAGQDIVALGAGEPDFDTPEHIKDAAIASLREGKTKYTAPTGIPELKKAVSDKLLRENGVKIPAEQVVITSGVTARSLARETGCKVALLGKPFGEIYSLALEKLKLPAQKVVAIGDTLATDILGARHAGIDCALVLTGVTPPERAKIEAKSWQIWPHYLLPDLRPPRTVQFL